MVNKRAFPRYPTIAQARLKNLLQGEAFVKDLSITGCRLEFSAAIALSVGEIHEIEIIPEGQANVEPFELTAEVRWSLASYDSFEVGFYILRSPRGKSFFHYLDYLAWKQNHPSSAGAS
ncbi:MAG: PilZ domain-containing protein [Treponemataceae bacterium]|jgi:hypothetical protein|uniref:PilZ domain-containing protein n=1 Tax=Treponema sp. J25 TaxID=2094121 RepID=UPI0010503A0B|nr:PilZ domain-containing protein [Treponema sp. J25]MCX7948538.1 PilZ domain-containing protein [Treponemataceae bacterium]HOJ99445.1 PilZ domain-containing protein [Termitinemataceae bacterium]TCW62182.1 PilZ domain-containing protein [Treponema sp. J25]HOM23310.1 PilZ domain-containing protein [Termitinemataceae bacterium]HPQ00514.1 PilZ domain-containing protein [Termitinemataceae bacterium]